jgi:REP element-mobilizing transposase RayT
MRPPRHKSENATFYHLLNRAAGDPRFFPFHRPGAARKFISLFEFYLRLYCCRLASFELMGNHYHCVVYFQQYRRLERDELHRRARLRFGKRWRLKTRHWGPAQWQQFNQNLFDVSRFMAHVNNEFSKWFNRRFSRRGHFWADRFKNPELLDLEAVQNTILYNELNATRAGVVRRPEDHKWGSAYWRWANKKSDLLIPLEELFPPERGRDAYSTYRELLYHSGAVATRDNQAVIADWIVRREQKRGFAQRGLFSRRLRFFTDGVAIGGHQPVSGLLQAYRERGLYRRRKNPIPQLGGFCFTLREQRSHAFSPG